MCERAVVIGKPAWVRAAMAMQHVAGYTGATTTPFATISRTGIAPTCA